MKQDRVLDYVIRLCWRLMVTSAASCRLSALSNNDSNPHVLLNKQLMRISCTKLH